MAERLEHLREWGHDHEHKVAEWVGHLGVRVLVEKIPIYRYCGSRTQIFSLCCREQAFADLLGPPRTLTLQPTKSRFHENLDPLALRPRILRHAERHGVDSEQ